MLLKNVKYYIGIDLSINNCAIIIMDDKKNIVKDILITSDKKIANALGEKAILNNEKRVLDKVDFVANSIKNIVNDYFYFTTDAIICIEDHVSCAFVWVDIYAIIKYIFRQNDWQYICVNPKTLKKYFTDSGSADKTQMAHYLRQNYNIDFAKYGDVANNHTDAAFLAIFANDLNTHNENELEKFKKSKIYKENALFSVYENFINTFDL